MLTQMQINFEIMKNVVYHKSMVRNLMFMKSVFM